MTEREDNKIGSSLLNSYSEDDLLMQILAPCVPPDLLERLAFRLLRRFGSIESLLSLSSNERAEIDDISPKIMQQIRICHRYHLVMLRKTVFSADLIKQPEICADYLRSKVTQVSGISQGFLYLDFNGHVCHEEYYRNNRTNILFFSENIVTKNVLKYNATSVILAVGMFGGARVDDEKFMDKVKAIRNSMALVECTISSLFVFNDGRWRILDV